MYSIFSIIPDPQKILELEAEEFAGFVMEYLNGLPENERHRINRHIHIVYKTQFPEVWPLEYRNRINLAFPYFNLSEHGRGFPLNIP
jgi:hypothetical protein